MDILGNDVHRRLDHPPGGMLDLLKFRFLAPNADNGAIVIDTKEQISTAGVRESNDLPRDLFGRRELPLELDVGTFAGVDQVIQLMPTDWKGDGSQTNYELRLRIRENH